MAFPDSNLQVTGAGVGQTSQVVPNLYYDRQFLDRLELNLMFDQLCDKKKMPKMSGNTITWIRYSNLAANTSALTEGTIPAAINMSASQITATPLQYGDFITMSDAIELKAIDPIVESAQELLAYRAALSIDTLIRNQLHGNVTNVFSSGAANEAATSAAVSAADVRKAVKTLKTVGTRPFDSDFRGLVHTATAYDLMSDTAVGGFLDVNKYTTNTPMLKGEIGKLWGVRFMESPNVQTGTGASSAVTYRNYIVGKGAIGIVDLAGKLAVETFRKPLGSAGAADPLNQISTVGHKFWMVAKVLDANRAVELYGTSAF
jgi:N4-gp56 family major capsid protein